MFRTHLLGAAALIALIFAAEAAKCDKNGSMKSSMRSTKKCVTPIGIDDSTPMSIRSSNLNLPDKILVPTQLKHFAALFSLFETAIQFRTLELLQLPIYSFGAMFHPTALEVFGRKYLSDKWRRCQPTNESEKRMFETQRKVTLAYTLFFMSDLVPNANIQPGLCSDLMSWGLSCKVCDKKSNCKSTDTPWGLAYQIVREVLFDFAPNDGWNADGSLSRSHNKIPFQDWRGAHAYTPVNSPWKINDLRRWQPLLESDNRGFLFFQQHVTSHIGDSALSIYVGDKEHCKLSVRDPRYNLRREAALALRRSSELNDVSKSEIVLYDGKLTSLIPLQVQYFDRAGIHTDSFAYIEADLMIITAIYESTLAVWRQKVIHDKIRPPSAVHKIFGNARVRAYAGVGQGTRTIRARDWEPYIRTMPHAEYPSGSSCVCKAFENAMKIITGGDNVAQKIGGPLTVEVPKGSSPIEPGMVPAQNLTLKYSKWSEVARACGDSRTKGGMHFTAAIPAGEELCKGIPDILAKAFKDLRAGRRPDYVVSPKGTRNPKVNRCSN